MYTQTVRAAAFGMVLLGALIASACGTLQIEFIPDATAAETGASTPRLSEAINFGPTAPAPLGLTEVITQIVTREFGLQGPEVVVETTAQPVGADPRVENAIGSEIISLDETWNRYTNYDHGFSISFPKTMASFRGSCTWNEEQASYRPQTAIVPVTIFEDSDAIYVAAEYYFELAAERTDATGVRYYDACTQVPNSLILLRDPRASSEPFWKLVASEVQDDTELDSFIKARYGSGCSLGEQAPSGQDGVYDVRIQGDGRNMEETQCLLNFGTVVKYYPDGNKVIAWDTGQAATFPADANYSVIRDEEMIKSFRFITGPTVIRPVTPEP
jgi:hypothetical protein